MAVLRPSDLPSSERPFRTLRDHGAASPGVSIQTRVAAGRLSGHLHVYSSLNIDAARAARLRQPEAARKLAAWAERLERSRAAKKIHKAIAALSASVPPDPSDPDAPPGLRRYAALRGQHSWAALDQGALRREWLVQSRAWFALEGSTSGGLADAVETLSRESEKARAKILEDQASVTTFYGVVRRLDASAAELESASGEALLLPRGDLERQGLAVVSQAVSLLTEVLPGGGSYNLPRPAVMLEPPKFENVEDPWKLLNPEEQSLQVSDLGGRDSSWVRRELARDPQTVPAAPLTVT